MLASHLTEKLEIHFEIEINAAPEKVWAKLATLDGMNEWFSKKLAFEFHEGGRFQMEVSIPEEATSRFSVKWSKSNHPKSWPLPGSNRKRARIPGLSPRWYPSSCSPPPTAPW